MEPKPETPTRKGLRRLQKFWNPVVQMEPVFDPAEIEKRRIDAYFKG